VTQHRDPGLEAGLVLDGAGQDVADAALGQSGVAERVLLGLAPLLLFELGDVRALGDDDDAEKLALTAAAVEVGGDIGERDRELRDDDQVGATTITR
jgi:hypothetical protein